MQPQTLVLFGNAAPFDQADVLLKQVGGLLKYAYQLKGGSVSVSELAALTGHTEVTIMACLRWLNVRSPMHLTALSEDMYLIEMQESAAPGNGTRESDRLNRALAETRAYRRYWLAQKW